MKPLVGALVIVAVAAIEPAVFYYYLSLYDVTLGWGGLAYLLLLLISQVGLIALLVRAARP